MIHVLWKSNAQNPSSLITTTGPVRKAERLHQFHGSTVHARHHGLVEGHHDAPRGVVDIVIGQGEDGPGPRQVGVSPFIAG